MLLSTKRLVMLYNTYKTAGEKEPLGVFFCRRYISLATEETNKIALESNDDLARELIDVLLERTNHHEFLPPLIRMD